MGGDKSYFEKNWTLILPRSFPIKFEIEDITDTARLSWYVVVAIYKTNHDNGTTYLILNIHRVSISSIQKYTHDNKSSKIKTIDKCQSKSILHNK